MTHATELDIWWARMVERDEARAAAQLYEMGVLETVDEGQGMTLEELLEIP